MDKEKAERIIKIVDWVRYIILAVFLTFLFATLSKAQATHDFGVWYSAGMEKKISADWNAGISTELRTKHRREYIDRWKLDIHSMYMIHQIYNFNVYNPSLIKGSLNLLSAFKCHELETKNYTSFSEAELRNSFCFLQTKEREMLKIKNLAK